MATEIDEQAVPPQSFDELKLEIMGRYPGLSGQLRRIAQFLLEKPNDSALSTITSIAAQVDAQPSSIVRFAKTFGYDGFSAMQKVFRSRLITEAPSYRERLRVLRQNRPGFDGAEAILNDFIDDGTASLEQLRQEIDASIINDAANKLFDATAIYILARGRAFPVAFYIAYALTGLEMPCRLLDGVGGLTEREARLATEHDALLAVSFRPYSPDVVKLVGDMVQKGIPSIAITDSPVSPLALQCESVLETHEEEGKAFRTLTAPLCLAQALVMTVGHKLMESNGSS